MKKAIAFTLSAAAASAFAGIAFVATPASATSEQCVPSDAWTETINHPAVGEPTIMVANPDYLPAIPAVDPVAEVPAVPGTPEVAEVSHTEYKRYSHKGVYAPSDPPPSAEWQENTANYDGAGHGTEPVGVPFQKDKPGKGNGDWFFWTSEVVIDTPYQAEVPGAPEIPGTPGSPAVPAVGEPTITVDNPDYVPAWTETIEHDAITCIPEKPEDIVTDTDWVLGQYGCDDLTVQLTRTVAVQHYVWDGYAWVIGGQSSSQQIEMRDLTDSEIAALDCETDVPPVVAVPHSEPAPTEVSPTALAQTGGGANIAAVILGGSLGLAGVILANVAYYVRKGSE